MDCLFCIFKQIQHCAFGKDAFLICKFFIVDSYKKGGDAKQIVM